MATIVAAAGGGAWTVGATWTGAVAPTAADDAVLDAASGNVTIDAGSVCRSLDCAAYTGTLTHSAAVTLTIGDATAGAGGRALRLAAAMTYTLGNAATSAITLVSTATSVQTITTAGKTGGNLTVNGVGCNYQLADAHTIGATATLTLTNGALDTNGMAASWGLLSSSNTNVRTLTLGASTVTITGVGTSWNVATNTNLTLNAGTSTIDLVVAGTATATFAGGGDGYQNVVFSGAGTTNTVTVTGANTFATLTITGKKTVVFPAGVTQTVSTLAVVGTAGNLITIESSSAGSAATLSKSSGDVEADYLSLKDSAATGGAAWWAGANSTSVSGNSGWVFTGRAATGTVSLVAAATLALSGNTGLCPPVTVYGGAYGEGAYGAGPYGSGDPGWPLALVYDGTLSRVRITVYGIDAFATTITVDRSVNGVTWTTVRGGQDIVVSTPDVTVDDYEFAGCADNIYRVRAYDADDVLIDTWQCVITTPLDGVWLKSISRPFLNRQVEVVDWTDITRPARNGTFNVVGRSAPVAVTDVRSTRRWTLDLITTTDTQIDELNVILASGEPLFIHTCDGCTDACDHAGILEADFTCAVPGGYVLVGDTVERRAGTVRSPRRIITLPLVEVAAPGPDVVGATSTWSTVLADFGTWSDLIAAMASWSEVLDLVGSSGDVVVP